MFSFNLDCLLNTDKIQIEHSRMRSFWMANTNSLKILSNTNNGLSNKDQNKIQYKPICANTLRIDWCVLNTNCSYSIHTVCKIQARYLPILIVACPIQTKTRFNANQYEQDSPIHTNTSWIDWYVLNTNNSYYMRAICIQYKIQARYLPILTLASPNRPKQAPIQTKMNQYSPIHTNTSWIDYYVLNTNGTYCISIGLPIWSLFWTNPGDTGPGTYSSKGTCCQRARRCVMHWQAVAAAHASMSTINTRIMHQGNLVVPNLT